MEADADLAGGSSPEGQAVNRLAEPEAGEVIEEEALPGGEGVGPQGIHQAQEAFDLLSVHRVQLGDVQVSPTLPVDLVLHQLRRIMGVGELDPASGGDAPPAPPAVPDAEAGDAADEQDENGDPERHGREQQVVEESFRAVPLRGLPGHTPEILRGGPLLQSI